MALLGRKEADQMRSTAAGSAEDFDNKCEPCMTMGDHKEAHAFCVTCHEYLCRTCREYHKKTNALRNHKILGRFGFDTIKSIGKSYNDSTEQCPLHQTENIKFYCPTHATLGCTNCMTIGHRACKIDYIPDKCADLANGKDYDDIMMELSKKLKEAEDVSKMAKGSRSDIHNISKEVIKKIDEFRAEINDRLDQMQQDILNNFGSKKSNKVKIVKEVIDTCGNIISDVKKLHSSLRVNKSNNQHAQLYIDIKRAESALKSEELTEARERIVNADIRYSFQRSADLEHLLSKEKVFGEIISKPCLESTKMKNPIDHLVLKDHISVKTKSDKSKCDITGCAVLPSNNLVLADYNNRKIQVVYVENKLVLAEKILDSGPFDVAVISQDKFAVTVKDKSRIDVIKVDDTLSCFRSINVKGECCGINCHQDRFYVVCLDPSSVVVLTTKGKELNNIPLDFLSHFYLPYITVRKDSNLLYISDCDNNSVVSVSLQGDILATYKHEDLQGPSGMCLLDDGSFLVCCFINGTIHQVKGDLKEGKILYEDRVYPQSICYSAQNDEVYVGYWEYRLKFFKYKVIK